MLNGTRIATGEFVDEQARTRYIRVIYQNRNGDVRESCWDSRNGWYTRPDQLIVTGAVAMLKTPIAVTFWKVGQETRVYFVDKGKKIRERVRSTDSAETSGQWVDGGDIKATLLPDTQLAVARSGEGDSNIRLFYQAQDETIHQIMYKKNSQNWTERSAVFPKAYHGSGLAAVVAKRPGQAGGEVRVFYEGTDKKLKEHFMSTAGDWTQSTLPSGFDLVAKASISAVNWGVDATSSNLQIRVFSIDAKGNLMTMSYDQSDDGWNYDPAQLTTTATNTTVGDSAVAAAQGKDQNDTIVVDVFYQPEPNTIGQFAVNYSKRVELGIPTSI